MKKPAWRKFVRKRVYGFNFHKKDFSSYYIEKLRHETTIGTGWIRDVDFEQIVEKMRYLFFVSGFMYARKLCKDFPDEFEMNILYKIDY